MIFNARFTGVAMAATLAGLATTSNAHAGSWNMGGTQWANNYFSAVIASFTVPPAPTAQSEAVTNIWPGLEDVTGQWVLQPVLSYGFLQEAWLMDNQVYGGSNGNPANSSCVTGNATYCDTPQKVNTGDTIVAGIAMDWSNLGTGCITSTGADCNYNIIWIDTTTGQSSVLKDWLQPLPLRWAQGLILETNFYNFLGLPAPSTCADYPSYYVLQASVALFEPQGSNLEVQDVTNLAAGYPGYGGGAPQGGWSNLAVPGCYLQAFATSGTTSSPTGSIAFWFWN
jgi:hypothetical protein